jgi:DNA-binding protein YbaB
MSGTEWLRDWERRVARVGTQARQARDALRGLTVTATSASGAVTVTVNSSGALQQVVFTERAEELSRPTLAEAVLEAARRAHAAAARGSAEALRPLVGESAAERYLAEHAPAAPEREAWR